MKTEVVSKDMGAKENNAKAWTTQEYSPAYPKAKLWNKRLWIGGSCWGKRIEFELVNKAWAHKKNSSYKFSQSPTNKRLSQIRISLCIVT